MSAHGRRLRYHKLTMEDPKLVAALFSAAEKGDLDEIARVLDLGVDVNVTELNGSTPLVDAVNYKQADAVALLLERGAVVELRNWDPPIIWAALDRSHGIIEMLLNHGAHIDQRDENGMTALFRLTGNSAWMKEFGDYDRHMATIRFLLDKGADVNTVADDGSSVIHEAAREGTVEVVRLLLDSGANVNAVEPDGWSVLMWAARKGYPEVTRLLLERGADVNHTCAEGGAAYDVSDSDAVDAVLIEFGADISP